MPNRTSAAQHERAHPSPHEHADWLTVETLLLCYARDFAANARWELPARSFAASAQWDRAPAHDPALQALWRQAPYPQWLRLVFDAAGVDVFCPVAVPSDSGRPVLARPVVARSRGTGRIRTLDLDDILDLVFAQYRAEAPLHDSTVKRLRSRLHQSRDILATILAHRRARPPWTGASWPGFIEAEQAVFAGHPFHPLAKSRWGFTPAEVQRYSPELEGAFQLHYFLAHPSLVVEDHVDCVDAFDMLAAELRADTATPAHVRTRLARHPDWRLLPVHPWEAAHLRRDDAVAQALAAGSLVELGPAGAPFTATTSVRTVYRRDLPFMLKLSLHVGITNCERINYMHELRKGCAVGRLLGSPWGERLARDVPGLRILRDTGFVTLAWQGRIIDGFSTLVRENALPEGARIAVAAALCEPATIGPSLLHEVLDQVASAHRVPRAEAARLWFDRYLALLLDSIVTAYDGYGMALEAHLQNLLVELDPAGLPARLYFRDNQGFFFRDDRVAEALRHVPELVEPHPCVLPDPMLHEPFAYYLMVNNILGVIQAFGAQGACAEAPLLRMLEARMQRLAASDATDFMGRLLRARGWPAKANLRMVLEDQDELRRPVETPATYIEVANPVLPFAHLCEEVVAPATDGVVHAHFFADYGATMRLRPMSLERDLALVHDWVNHSHAKEFWCMDGPIHDLEAYYLDMLASPYAHAFIAHLDDEPAFLIETYWAPRDVIGRHYDVQPGDHGFHMLVAPPRERRPGFTTRAFQVAAELLFRHPRVRRVIAEPDRRNHKALRVMQRVGYELDHVVALPDKEASLMICTRERLLQCCPDARPHIAPPHAPGRAPGAAYRAPHHQETPLSLRADER